MPAEDVTAFGRPSLEGSFELFKQRYFTIPVPSDLSPLLQNLMGFCTVKQKPQSQMQVRDVAPGLWIWRLEHPRRKPGQGWEPLVASTFVESGGHRLALDPIGPSSDSTDVWNRVDARPPTSVVILKPDHVRDVDLLVRRYRARAFGPRLFFREDVSETDLEFIEPGSRLPGGLVALYDGRGRNETPLWLPEQRALVFAEARTAPGGELRVWASPSQQHAKAFPSPPQAPYFGQARSGLGGLCSSRQSVMAL